MTSGSLNSRFLLLQGLLALLECIAVAFLSPFLLHCGYTAGRIGLVMTLAALAALLSRPLWGYLNDRLSCARQATLAATAASAGFFFLLVHSGGRAVPTVLAVVGIYMTIVCMMNFADTWAMRLISEGRQLNYGATRAGGSFAYALGAMLFGAVIASRGFKPGSVVMLLLLLPMAAVALSLPNPKPTAPQSGISLGAGLSMLAGKPVYLLMLAAYFLCMLSSSAVESFYSVLLLRLGGNERDVGIALFVQAISEVPVMVLYRWARPRIPLSAAGIMAVSMFFYGVKSLTLGLALTCGQAVAAALLQALSFALFVPACVEFMLQTVPGSYLATAHLVFIAVGQGAASMVGNSFGGALADRLGISAMFRWTSILAFLACLLAGLTATRQKRRRLL